MQNQAKQNVYITLIEFLERKTSQGDGTVLESDAIEFLNQEFPELSDRVRTHFFRSIVTIHRQARHGEPAKWILNVDAYFQLLEHQELEEARSSSRKALNVAIAAIVVTFLTAVASIFVQFTRPTDVVLDDRQLAELIDGATSLRQVALTDGQIARIVAANQHPRTIIWDSNQLEQVLDLVGPTAKTEN